MASFQDMSFRDMGFLKSIPNHLLHLSDPDPKDLRQDLLGRLQLLAFGSG